MTQLRGGHKPFEDGLYFEGPVAYQKYNPAIFFPGIAKDSELDAIWSSVAATVGIGWEFPLINEWKIRPIAHLSFGEATANTIFSDIPILSPGSNSNELIDGDFNAFRIDARLGIFCEAQFGPWQLEYRFRQIFLKFNPFDELQAENTSVSCNQATLFSRHRYALDNDKLFELPTQLVLDAGIVLYHS